MDCWRVRREMCEGEVGMFATKSRLLTVFVTAGILLAFAIVDYATPWIMRWQSGPDSNVLFWMALGGCVAEVTLIAAWAVFAPGNFVVRLPWSVLLGLMMWYILVFAQRDVQRAGGYFNEQDIADVGISLLLGVTALQIPLWIAKRAFRYRMLAPGEVAAPATTERFQFEIKHLLIGTLFLALALSPLRIVIPGSVLQHVRLEWQMFVILGVAIVANLVATLPCLWCGFASSDRLVPLGFGWLVYALIVTGIEFGVLCAALRGPPDSEVLKVFGLLYLTNVTQGAVVFGVMRCYRALGYRLQRVPRDMPPPERLQETWEAVLVETEDDSNQTRPNVE
jgi:hypothetical protein